MDGLGAEGFGVAMLQMFPESVVQANQTRFVSLAHSIDDLDILWNEVENLTPKRVPCGVRLRYKTVSAT